LPVVQGDNNWRISMQGQSQVTFKYSLGSIPPGGDLDRSSLIIRGDAVFFENRAVFAYPSIEPKTIRVLFDVPPQWTIGTSFIPDGEHNYWVEGTPTLKSDLLDNVTRLGIADTIVAETCGDLEITFVFFRPPDRRYGYEEFWYTRYGNTREEQMHEYIQLVCQSIQYFTSLLGNWPGGSRYWISTMPTGSSEVPTSWNRWIQAWPRERYSQVAHHVLHAWIWWTEDAPLRSTAPEWMWIQEGIPTFYEHRLSTALTGDPQWAGMSYTSYLITKRAAQFGLLQKDTVNKYAYAEMRVLALDQAIRQATKGTKSVDDLLRSLGNRFGQKRQRFSREELIKVINEIAGTDLSAFYNRYLAGEVSKELLPLDNSVIVYRDSFFKWMDAFIAPTGRGNTAKGKRTLFFVALEIGVLSGQGIESEHFVGTGACICNLQQFEKQLRALRRQPTDTDIINVLSSITGRTETDFFDFYTVGNLRPSVDEIAEWLGRAN